MIVQNLPALQPITLLLFSLIIPLVSFIRIRDISWWVTIFAMILTNIVAVYGFFYVLEHGTQSYHWGGWQPPMGIEYTYDLLSAFIALVINAVSLIVLVHGRYSLRQELEGREMAFYSMTLMMLCGFNGILLTGDLFNLYVFIEISSLASYGLIGIGSKKAPFAAFRYLIVGTVGASLYLLGIAYIFVVTGSLNIADLQQVLPVMASNNPTIIVGFVLIMVGIAIKMAIFPMHGWLPDSYTYAPTLASTLIAPIGTKVAAYVMIRMVFYMFEVELFTEILPAADLLAFLSGVGIILGSVLAIAQKELKRMLAYSSVSQIAYIGLGIGLASPLGFIGAVLHLLNHAIMKALLFMVVGTLRLREGHSNIDRFNDTYRKRYPWTMLAFSVAAISMIGLPPFAGFFSKWYLALATIEANAWPYLVVILVSSLLNVVYFFRIMEKVYLRNPAEAEAAAKAQSHDEHHGESQLVEPPDHHKDVRSNEPPFSMVWTSLLFAASLVVIGFANVFIVQVIVKMLPEGM